MLRSPTDQHTRLCLTAPQRPSLRARRLAESILAAQQDLEASGVLAPIVGHVGDGNFHAIMVVDTNNP